MNVQETVENFNHLAAVIMEAVEADPEILGSDKWLRSAIHEWDLRIDVCTDGTLNVWGSVYTCQTMGFEQFDFNIDPKDLDI